jgi:D-alanine-D-alanine ligase
MMKRVALLKGGWSSEREVSLSSGAAAEKALRALGYDVTAIDVQPDIGKVLTEMKPDVVFNALHGRYGEDGTIQGLLELLKIPYTHSGVLASALAMHKARAKAVFRSAGLRCPEGGVFTIGEVLEHCPVAMPFVVKPVADGSSVNVFLVFEAEDMKPMHSLPKDLEMLVEPYIAGREIQVAVLDGKALGAIEIRTNSKFYDYEAKYTVGKAEHLMPAPLEEADYEEVLRLAERAHKALGCRGLTRSDFRYDDTGIGQSLFYLLEINTQPGMTELSLAPEIAAHHGITFIDLVRHLVENATTDEAASHG